MSEPYLELEKLFGEWIKLPNMVGCSSGTAALHLALEAMRFPLGSEVIVPEYTFVGCARAVTLAGLVPRFIDCGDDLLLDPKLIKGLVNEKTKAIMPVHIYGRCCNMVEINKVCRDENIRIIEDCAQSHGARPEYGPEGSITDAYCWSFYRNKIVAGEEGGMISFRDEDQAELAKCLRSNGSIGSSFTHLPRGMNYRLANAAAIQILQSLGNADKNLAKRKQIEDWYYTLTPPHWQMPKRDVVWMYDIQINYRDVDTVVSRLQECKVAARGGFKPMSEQQEYAGYSEKLNALRLSKQMLYLPVNPSMDFGDVASVCHSLMQAVGQAQVQLPVHSL